MDRSSFDLRWFAHHRVIIETPLRWAIVDQRVAGLDLVGLDQVGAVLDLRRGRVAREERPVVEDGPGLDRGLRSASGSVSTELGMTNGRNETSSRSMTPSTAAAPSEPSMRPSGSTPPLIARRSSLPAPSVAPVAPWGVDGSTASSDATATMVATEIGRMRSGELAVRRPAFSLDAERGGGLGGPAVDGVLERARGADAQPVDPGGRAGVGSGRVQAVGLALGAGRWLLQYGLLAQRSARERDAGPSASG